MRILHISDIHMNIEEKLEEDEVSIVEKISDAIQGCENRGLNLCPDIIVVTGDFTTTATASEFELAFQQLKNFYENEYFNIKKILLVPGNHDYLWKEDDKPALKENRYIEYRNFRDHCRTVGVCNDNRVSDNNLEKELEKYLISHIYEEEEDFAVLLMGMNSVVLDSEERKGQGFFRKSNIRRARD